jgi:hypothetical protein
MNWNEFFGILCIATFLLPITVIIYYRFYKHRSLTALLVYYILTILYNMMYLQLLPLPDGFRSAFGMITNYLDAPLMMTALLFFCPNKQKQTKVYLLGATFIVYEAVITIAFGFKPIAVVYILGPGIVLILAYAGFLFVRQVKFTIIHGKNTGRTLMLASILFVYACYSLIYYFFYIQKTKFIGDTYLLYFLASIFSSILMCIGLVLANKRLKKLDDLKITRKELHLFFNS